VDQDLDEVFFLIDVGRHPERIDHIDRETALLCDRHMVDETRAIEVSVEALWFLQEDEVRPAAAARHDSHIFLGADQPLDITGGHQGEVGHDDERRAVELPKCPVDRFVEGLLPDGGERVLMFEGMSAEQGSAAS